MRFHPGNIQLLRAAAGLLVWCAALSGCNEAPLILADISAETKGTDSADTSTSSETPSGASSSSDTNLDTQNISEQETDSICGDTRLLALSDNRYAERSIEVSGFIDPMTFKDVTHIEQSLVIKELNAAVYDLSVFESLRCIGGYLVIVNVDNLEDLAVFSNLKRIDGNLTIAGNRDLEDVSGLEGVVLTDGGFKLEIFSNPELSTCSAVALGDAIRQQGWHGEICIQSNDDDDHDECDEKPCWP